MDGNYLGHGIYLIDVGLKPIHGDKVYNTLLSMLKLRSFYLKEAFKLKTARLVTLLLMGLSLCVCNAYANDEAAKLNQHWKNSNRTGCESSDPDYYCSGVIAHVFDDDSLHTSNSDPWMPSDRGTVKVSFSYLRQDIPVDYPLYESDTTIGAGYIFAPIASLTSAEQYTLLCEYPINGSTDQRTDKGCGPTCDSVGVKTSDAYLANVNLEPKTMCSASPDQAGFTMMLDTFKKLKAEQPPPSFMINWNELVIQEWSHKENKDVPIEAFFYEIRNKIVDQPGKIKADLAAQSYHRATGIDVPVVAVDVDKLKSGDDAPFSNETQ